MFSQLNQGENKRSYFVSENPGDCYRGEEGKGDYAYACNNKELPVRDYVAKEVVSPGSIDAFDAGLRICKRTEEHSNARKGDRGNGQQDDNASENGVYSCQEPPALINTDKDRDGRHSGRRIPEAVPDVREYRADERPREDKQKDDNRSEPRC